MRRDIPLKAVLSKLPLNSDGGGSGDDRGGAGGSSGDDGAYNYKDGEGDEGGGKTMHYGSEETRIST